MHTDGLLHAILDAGEIGIALLDHAGTVVLWNHWLAEASAIGSDQACGRTLTEVFPEIIGTRIAHAVSEALQHGMAALLSSSLHKRLLPLSKSGRDGTREPMKQIAVIKPLPVNDQNYCLLQVTDTTSAVAREQVLRQQARTMQALAENYRLSELHMRAIVDNTGDAIITFDAKGIIGTYNAAAERIFGYRAPEIVGKDIGVLMPLLGASTRHSSAEAALRFIGDRHEIGGVRKDGNGCPLELSVSEMELGGQRLFIGIAHDITERKKANEELRNQKEWLATLINAVPDIICFKDGEGRWLVANEFYLNLFELSGIDYQGRTATELAQLSWRYSEDLVASLETDRQAWREGRAVS